MLCRHSQRSLAANLSASGVYDYRALPLPGSFMFRDPDLMASWSYDYNSKEMVSFDSEEVGRWKGEWIARSGLGGVMVRIDSLIRAAGSDSNVTLCASSLLLDRLFLSDYRFGN